MDNVKELHQKELAHVAIELVAINNRRDELMVRYKELQIVLNTVEATEKKEPRPFGDGEIMPNSDGKTTKALLAAQTIKKPNVSADVDVGEAPEGYIDD